MKNSATVPTQCDVVIIGAGPAGLATAIELKKRGVKDIVVLERHSKAGGNPRHCGHSPFGMREFKRVYFGAKYAERLVSEALKQNVAIAVNTTVTSFEKGGLLTLSTEQGIQNLHAKKIILSTGIREKPRSARLITGQRPLGIMTAGALQSIVYLSNKKPFERPVIIGSELVSFSAVATCRHAKIKPVAMIEENDCVTAWSFLQMYPRLMGAKFLHKTKLIKIHGKERVTGVTVSNKFNKLERIDCDGVIFTGQFIPEASLARMGHLEVDSLSNGPVVDQFGRCSDPDFYAVGNVLRPVETAGWCWKEGQEKAQYIADVLSEKRSHSNNEQQLIITVDSFVVKYCVPQRITLTDDLMEEQSIQLQLRFSTPVQGQLIISSKSGEISSKKITALPERRVLLNLSKNKIKKIINNREDLIIEFKK